MVTRVEIWENVKRCESYQSKGECFHDCFEFSQRFTSTTTVHGNKKENSFLFLLWRISGCRFSPPKTFFLPRYFRGSETSTGNTSALAGYKVNGFRRVSVSVLFCVFKNTVMLPNVSWCSVSSLFSVCCIEMCVIFFPQILQRKQRKSFSVINFSPSAEYSSLLACFLFPFLSPNTLCNTSRLAFQL